MNRDGTLMTVLVRLGSIYHAINVTRVVCLRGSRIDSALVSEPQLPSLFMKALPKSTTVRLHCANGEVVFVPATAIKDAFCDS